MDNWLTHNTNRSYLSPLCCITSSLRVSGEGTALNGFKYQVPLVKYGRVLCFKSQVIIQCRKKNLGRSFYSLIVKHLGSVTLATATGRLLCTRVVKDKLHSSKQTVNRPGLILMATQTFAIYCAKLCTL